MQKTKFSHGVAKVIGVILVALQIFACQGGNGVRNGAQEPPIQEPARDDNEILPTDCPVPPKNAGEAGIYFETEVVNKNLVTKAWQGHSHAFAELMNLGWTEGDFQTAAPLSQHVDLAAKSIRFANADIAEFLKNKQLCPKTIKFLFSYLAKKEQGAFLEKVRKSMAKADIDIVMAHQTKRFKDLETILNKDAKYHVKFPGQSAEKHALGTKIAAGAWGDPPKHKRMLDHITALIKDLEAKFPGRIHFGMIGDYKFDPNISSDCDRTKPNAEDHPGPQSNGTFMIHVWGANEGNFNYPDQQPGTFGSGQASCFEKQRIGVFGISTMPSVDEVTLMADDKLLPKY